MRNGNASNNDQLEFILSAVLHFARRSMAANQYYSLFNVFISFVYRLLMPFCEGYIKCIRMLSEHCTERCAARHKPKIKCVCMYFKWPLPLNLHLKTSAQWNMFEHVICVIFHIHWESIKNFAEYSYRRCIAHLLLAATRFPIYRLFSFQQMISCILPHAVHTEKFVSIAIIAANNL